MKGSGTWTRKMEGEDLKYLPVTKRMSMFGIWVEVICTLETSKMTRKMEEDAFLNLRIKTESMKGNSKMTRRMEKECLS